MNKKRLHWELKASTINHVAGNEASDQTTLFKYPLQNYQTFKIPLMSKL